MRIARMLTSLGFAGAESQIVAPPFLQTPPRGFAITSPSGCEGDLHSQAVNHARRTQETGRSKTLRPLVDALQLEREDGLEEDAS
jgi:hypothetical protein